LEKGIFFGRVANRKLENWRNRFSLGTHDGRAWEDKLGEFEKGLSSEIKRRFRSEGCAVSEHES
jgi:hypothetical protein